MLSRKPRGSIDGAPARTKVDARQHAASGDQPTGDPPWRKLRPELIGRIASFLTAAEVAISLKLLDKETAAALRDFRRVAVARKPGAWVFESFGIDDKSSSRPVASKWFCLALPDLDLGLITRLEWGREAFWRRLNLRQRRQWLCVAASSRDRGALHAALQHCGCSLTSPVLAAAAAVGDCDTCSFLAFNNGCPWDACVSWVAAGHGQLEVLKWAEEVEEEYDMASRAAVPQPSQLLEAVCAGGHPAALERVEEAWNAHMQMNYDPYSAADDDEMTAMGAVWAAIQGYDDDAIGSGAHSADNGSSGGAASGSAWRGQGGAAGAARGGGAARAPAAAAAAAVAPAAAAAVPLRDRVLERCMNLLLNDFPTSAHNRKNVLWILAKSCPLDLLRRYYDRLVAPPVGADDHDDDDEEAEDGGVASSGWDRRQLLVSALESRTPDWEQKADWLLGEKWGAAAADSLARLLSCERPSDERGFGFGLSLWRGVAKLPDCLQRLSRLAARGISMRTHKDVSEAVCGAAEAGRHEPLQHLLEGVCRQPRLAPAAVVTEEAVQCALRGGHLLALRLLHGATGAAFTLQQLRDVVAAGHVEVVRWMASTPGAVATTATAAGGAAADGGAAGAGGAAGSSAPAAAPAWADAPWSWAFSRLAEAGCDVALLRLLHEERGAAVDLVAVASGGSVEQLEWAVAALRAEGQQPQVLTANQLWEVACEWGNTAAADWLLSESLAELPDAVFVCGQLRADRSSGLCAGARWWLDAMDERAEDTRRDGSGHAFFAGLRSHWARAVEAVAAAVERSDVSELLPYQLNYLRCCRYEAARGVLYDVRHRRRRGVGELDAAEEEVQDAWDGMDHGQHEWESEQSYMSDQLSSRASTDDEGEDEEDDEGEDDDDDEGEDEGEKEEDDEGEEQEDAGPDEGDA